MGEQIILHGGTVKGGGDVRITLLAVISLNQQIDDLVKGQHPRASKLGRQDVVWGVACETSQDGPSVQTMAAGTNDSCTAEQTSSSNFEEEDVAAAVSLLEFCANLEDYTPTVSSTCTCTI